jgi:hypothetical protein
MLANIFLIYNISLEIIRHIVLGNLGVYYFGV